ncbi:hypothetical protein SUGI_0573340 [Cryptomeria japonica]|nr:hypothetical protein SUGI_0573340 [Cryptomeria japonica]
MELESIVTPMLGQRGSTSSQTILLPRKPFSEDFPTYASKWQLTPGSMSASNLPSMTTPVVCGELALTLRVVLSVVWPCESLSTFAVG